MEVTRFKKFAKSLNEKNEKKDKGKIYKTFLN